jgi:antitoxin (DNA-binding transcriptional repressor) of toxin-antitoxin stability system
VKKTINVTEAVRNFADCVTPHYQNVTFVLLKKGAPFARLVPDNEKICLGRDLAETELSPDEARAWRRDLRTARKTAKPPADRWA